MTHVDKVEGNQAKMKKGNASEDKDELAFLIRELICSKSLTGTLPSPSTRPTRKTPHHIIAIPRTSVGTR